MLKETLFTMSRQELERVKVVEKIIERSLTQRIAAEMLGLSVRQIKRLCRNYLLNGEQGLISKHRNKISNRKFDKAFKDHVIEIVKAQYHDFGPTFATEKLLERQGIKISHETVRTWMIEAKIWRPKRAHKARIHQTRERRPRRGELIQIDGSAHDWFEGRAPKCCLLVFIDDATSEVMNMRFEEVECAAGYFRAVRDYIRLHGKPISWYSDRHGIFRINQTETPEGQTQFARAMAQLEIEIICANSAQAKGRVERANGTMQDRLIKEMRLLNISSIEEANGYLPEFIAKHNARFAQSAASAEDAHRPNTHDAIDLDRILCFQYTRTLSKNLEIQFKGNKYQIITDGKGYRLQGASVYVTMSLSGEIKLYRGTIPLSFKVIEGYATKPPIMDRKVVSAALDKHCPNPKKAHKPAHNHPWKRYAVNHQSKPVTQKGTFLTCAEGDISILR